MNDTRRKGIPLDSTVT